MSSIYVYSLPSSAEAERLQGSACVVIDVLRATTVLAYALAAGVKEIVPLLDIDQARQWKTGNHVILGGERKGLPIEGFDLGNSPQHYTPEKVGGKTLVFTTTNGTVAMHAAQSARSIYLAALVNADAVARRLQNEENITILCAGTCGEETEEDLLLAGCLVNRLIRNKHHRLNDTAESVRRCWSNALDAGADVDKVIELLHQSRGGQNLIKLGLEADIVASAQLDSINVVPQLNPQTMRITSES
jgi:2-phosphosulfolactate phosphatase